MFPRNSPDAINDSSTGAKLAHEITRSSCTTVYRVWASELLLAAPCLLFTWLRQALAGRSRLLPLTPQQANAHSVLAMYDNVLGLTTLPQVFANAVVTSGAPRRMLHYLIMVIGVVGSIIGTEETVRAIIQLSREGSVDGSHSGSA